MRKLLFPVAILISTLYSCSQSNNSLNGTNNNSGVRLWNVGGTYEWLGVHPTISSWSTTTVGNINDGNYRIPVVKTGSYTADSVTAIDSIARLHSIGAVVYTYDPVNHYNSTDTITAIRNVQFNAKAKNY